MFLAVAKHLVKIESGDLGYVFSNFICGDSKEITTNTSI